VQNLSVRLTDLRREHAKLASVFHEEYPSVKAVQRQIAELEQAIDQEIGLVVSRGQREYRAAARREALIRQALNEENARVQALAKSGDATDGYESLKRDVVTNQGQVSVLNQKLKEVSISAALKAANVGVVDRAEPPMGPYGTPLTMSVGLAVLVGLVLAVGGVLLQEHFDTSMRTVEDVDVYLGVPTLAAIPAAASEVRLLGRGESPGVQGDWRRIDQEAPQQSPLGEAFAALRTAVLLRDDGAATRSLLITSAQPEEGKTTISINLALSLARLHHRVLLVDANMRAPSVEQALGLPTSRGLVDYLTTDTDWRACVHVQARANLDVLVGGRPDASPADLLSLPRMRTLVADASRDYAFVVIDSPALLTHPADVQSLARLTDTVLLAVRQGATPREVVASAISQLDHVSGVVLNRLDARIISVPRQDFAAASA
jgi:capsular exopolysaccharide synthesis family protein